MLRQNRKERIWQMEGLTIRMAGAEDAAALLAIYAPYVRDTAVSFEYAVPSLEEFARRVRDTLKKYPYLVAEQNGMIVGYAYASPLSARAAYDWTAETSIYVEWNHRGRGVGKALYAALEDLLRRQNVVNLGARVACAAAEDARLTGASVAFHKSMGYREIGRYEKCGYKFGAWYDVMWMRKTLREHPATPEPFVPLGGITII